MGTRWVPTQAKNILYIEANYCCKIITLAEICKLIQACAKLKPEKAREEREVHWSSSSLLWQFYMATKSRVALASRPL